ncbi:MAG: hypothetical protein II032_03550 [Treponema sp.]|nr:hypothetical protein [Treponema sp.]
MKKIVMGAAALLCAASMFAVDFAATVKMAGDIAGGAVTEGTDTTYIWKLNSNDQKDADALKLSVSGDQAGASFQFWYKYTAGAAPTTATTADKNTDGTLKGTYTTAVTTNSMLQARSTSIWVKPIDQLKITLGDVSCGIFSEKLHYWKDPCGNDYASASSWDHGYSSYATVEGAGIAAELTPIDGLTVVAGIAAGCDTNFISFVENVSTVAVKAYGVSAAYNLSSVADLPVTIGVSWRDEGTDAIKILAIGADYGNAFAEGFYGMLNARMFFSQKVGSATVSATGKDYKLTGIAFDNFFRLKSGAMTIDLRAPFVLRGLAGQTVNAAGVATALNATNDPSYMYLSAKFSYALDGLTIYVGAGSDYDDNLNGWVFNSTFGDTFNLTIHPGVTFNVGACAFDIGARFDIKDAVATTANANVKYHPFAWSIPFTATIGF